MNSYLKGENNNPQEILYDVKVDLSSFFLILTQETAIKKGKYSPDKTIYKKCGCIKCNPQVHESAAFIKTETKESTLRKFTLAVSASNRFKLTNIGTNPNLKYQQSNKETASKNEKSEKDPDIFMSCNFEDSFRKDFEDLNSERANTSDKKDNNQANGKIKSTDSIYEVQKIILMLRIFNLKVHVQKFRDNKLETKEPVIFLFLFLC